MSLCLSMIVKNEAHVIRRCLRSVKPFIDYYSISDTGSTDNTMDIIREELAGIPGVLQSDPWEGFGPNRNIARSRAKGDYILSIDADEVLYHHGGPIVLDPDYDGFHCKLIYPDIFQWVLRITRNDPRWKWYFNLHNALLFEGESRIKKIENITFRAHNDSNQNRMGDKSLRQLAILEKEPPTPRNVFYHAQTLMNLNRYDEAIKKYHERAAMGGWEEEVYYSLFRAGDMMRRANYPFDETAGALYRAYLFRPGRFEALAALCDVLRKKKLWQQIYNITSIEVKLGDDLLFVDQHSAWSVYFEHAFAAQQLGKIDESQAYFQKVEGIVDASPAAENYLQLSFKYYEIERWEDCKTAARNALQLKPDYPEALNNICCACNKLGLFTEGKQAAEEALRFRQEWPLAQANLDWSIRELNKK